eukprot:NODE_1697_length_1328_cov_7.394058_g1411_i0.p1 GENE.NODE_1697_length_1328_cov_7.394058_g1411_i0~~NODE_1697_length_1328_cov_7.394058_g1411_i0.p1  ORF type:complete len:315 (-),score=65.77 NODE_1697_length_1328_cov_7.394058_g1411_i0:98-1042(-)
MAALLLEYLLLDELRRRSQDGDVYHSPALFPLSIVVAVGFLFARYFVQQFLATPFLRIFDPIKAQDSGHHDKFNKVMWHWVAYMFLFIVDCSYLWGQPWAFDFTDALWEGHYPFLVEERNSLWVPYVIQIGFYIHCCIEALFLDLRDNRADFGMILIHHILALLLLCASFESGFHRIGLHVMANSEPGDLALYWGKIWHYATKSFILHAICLLGIVVTWVVTRLGVMFTILVSSFFWSPPCMWWAWKTHVLQLILVLLFALQITWFVLIIQVSVNTAKNKKLTDHVHDPSSPRGSPSSSPTSPGYSPRTLKKLN